MSNDIVITEEFADYLVSRALSYARYVANSRRLGDHWRARLVQDPIMLYHLGKIDLLDTFGCSSDGIMAFYNEYNYLTKYAEETDV